MDIGDETCWEYLDPKGELRGPFPTSRMIAWYDAKMLPDNLRVRNSPTMPMTAIRELFPVPLLPFRSPPVLPRPPPQPARCTSQWRYRDTKGVVQGPFSSQQMAVWYDHGMLPPTLKLQRTTDPAYLFAAIQDYFPAPLKPFVSPAREPLAAAPLPTPTPAPAPAAAAYNTSARHEEGLRLDLASLGLHGQPLPKQGAAIQPTAQSLAAAQKTAAVAAAAAAAAAAKGAEAGKSARNAGKQQAVPEAVNGVEAAASNGKGKGGRGKNAAPIGSGGEPQAEKGRGKGKKEQKRNQQSSGWSWSEQSGWVYNGSSDAWWEQDKWNSWNGWGEGWDQDSWKASDSASPEHSPHVKEGSPQVKEKAEKTSGIQAVFGALRWGPKTDVQDLLPEPMERKVLDEGLVWEERWVSPLAVRFSQGKIHPFFHERGPISEVLLQIRKREEADGPGGSSVVRIEPPFPPIRLLHLKQQGVLVTLDNRRLYALQRFALENWPAVCFCRALCVDELTPTRLKSENRKFTNHICGLRLELESRSNAFDTFSWVTDAAEKEAYRFFRPVSFRTADKEKMLSLFPILVLQCLLCEKKRARLRSTWPVLSYLAQVLPDPTKCEFPTKRVLMQHILELARPRRSALYSCFPCGVGQSCHVAAAAPRRPLRPEDSERVLTRNFA
eukprot:TRINITY_DN7324_c0_g1_i2.p1 TRINITY_DN7324_c0_g1~~TRINITY_DN7324_c0_g1_i2.p1  ORF type:complete len:666 (+),score=142.33 TRINITY_DN7324_c0_g1_i2:98-2095(+)